MRLTLKQLIGKQVIIQTTAKYPIRGTITQLFKDGKQWVVKVQAHEDDWTVVGGMTDKLTSHWIPTNSITAVEEMLHPEQHHIVKLDAQGNPIPFEPIETKLQPELPKVEQPKPKGPTLPIPLKEEPKDIPLGLSGGMYYCLMCSQLYSSYHSHICTSQYPTKPYYPNDFITTPYTTWPITTIWRHSLMNYQLPGKTKKENE